MMKLLMATAVATCLLSNTYAQEDVQIDPIAHNPSNPNLAGKYAIKVYNNTTFGNEQHLSAAPGYKRTLRHNQYLSPSVAVQIANRRKNFHEIELSDFSINNRSEKTSLAVLNGLTIVAAGSEVTTTTIALRYEYVRTFAKRSNSRLVPAIGFSAQPYYASAHVTPYTTANFPIRDTRAGLRAGVVPRLTWHTNKRLFFDVNIPLNLVDMAYVHQNIQDPALPTAQQKYGIADFSIGLPAFMFRIGAGVKL